MKTVPEPRRSGSYLPCPVKTTSGLYKHTPLFDIAKWCTCIRVSFRTHMGRRSSPHHRLGGGSRSAAFRRVRVRFQFLVNSVATIVELIN